MQIAVIGGGVSGLACAHLLARRHRVTVYEAAGRLGGHTHTVPVTLGSRTFDVDTGFIVFNYRTYPLFTRLIAQLGVAAQPSSMSFSVTCERTGLEYGGASLAAVFAQRRNLVSLGFHRMLVDILRFNRTAPRLLTRPGPELTVAEYLAAAQLSRRFVDQYLVPLGASIWSCPPGEFFRFPARFLIRFLDNHGMLTVDDHPTWQVIRGGSSRYLAPLVAPFRDRLRLGTPVERIRRVAGGVEVTAAGDAERFDHVVVGCHADQALAMLAAPTDTERDLLGAFPYQHNDVVLHTDTRLLPRRRAAWAAWNYRVPREPGDAVTLTYDMNILQSLDADEVACVTVNPGTRIDPRRVLRRFVYHHPVYTLAAPEAQRRRAELIDHDRISYCGAYWGFGFHEDGVRSGLEIAAAFGERL